MILRAKTYKLRLRAQRKRPKGSKIDKETSRKRILMTFSNLKEWSNRNLKNEKTNLASDQLPP